MSHNFSPQVQQLVAAQLETGLYADENEVLLEALHALEQQRQEDDADEGEYEDDWRAIKEALDGIEAGTNKPMSLEEAVDQVRKKHGLT